MKILESFDYMITIPASSEEIATLLENYAGDWSEVLPFLAGVAESQGIVIKSTEIAEIMRRKYEID